MPLIEHRSILSGSGDTKLMTLPKGHTLLDNATEVRLIISNNLVIVTDTKAPMDKIKSELETLIKDLG